MIGAVIRVILPAHLRTLARVDGEVKLEIDGEATQRAVLDALEVRYPMLRGTIRDHLTQQRRPFVRFFACEQDLSHESPDAPLPEAVVKAIEPFLVVGAIAGGITIGSAMYFQQFYLTCLSHASYMLGSDGLACVVDPQRDVSLYLEEARERGLVIRYIVETHLHADFVSGHRELAERTGAAIYLGARAGATFPHVGVKDGDEVRFGRVVLRFLETPGHTLESVSVLVIDLDRSAAFAVLTGDTLFIGDVGRPDLAKDKTPQELAGILYDSLHQKLLTLADDVEVYPAHGAGSLCGKQMRPERQSTIGKERALNYALRPRTKEEFVRLLTAELPERPGYFALDAEINRSGAPAIDHLPPHAELTADEVLARQSAGAIVLDTRPFAQFGAGHIPGAVNIALAGQYATWAATLLGLDQDIILVAEDEAQLEESRMRLARVGIEHVAGGLRSGMAQWAMEERPADQIPQISIEDLNRALESDPGLIQIIDVRRTPEWDDGHIPGAMLVPLQKLEATFSDLDRERILAVHCKGGYRSSIACSLLQRAGFPQVMNVIGGFDAWLACGLPAKETPRAPRPQPCDLPL